MSLKIDKKIPMPPPKNHVIYPFKEMKIGDSFLVAGNINPRLAASRFKKANKGWNYASRKEGDYVRIWRTA